MQPKITRLEWLKQTVLALDDDLTRPWSDYPCLEWPYNIERHGYGVISVANGIDAPYNVRVHREAYRIANGQLDDEIKVLHRCDNPPCFRPAHLFTGTQADNLADMYRKGRARVTGPRLSTAADRNHKAKLDWTSVREIRRLYATGVSQDKLAVQFHICQTAVSHIVRNSTWKEPR